MTSQQLWFYNSLYVTALLLTVFFTRPLLRRVLGAMAGAVVFSIVAMALNALGEKAGLWRMNLWEPRQALMVYVDFVISAVPIYLITWRIARRFGIRGLAVTETILILIGPPRDYAYMKRFPEWGRYAPGPAPVFAVAVVYALILPVGHSVMRLIAGPANADRLARRPWETARSRSA